jgi:hypothetical protein
MKLLLSIGGRLLKPHRVVVQVGRRAPGSGHPIRGAAEWDRTQQTDATPRYWGGVRAARVIGLPSVTMRHVERSRRRHMRIAC